MTALLLPVAFVLIVVGALVFTNAVEWLGHRLELGRGAVGGLLAAVGTALPESLIPVVALVSGGGEEAEQIAIGAIIGAPFLLGTLGMLLVAVAAQLFSARREQGEAVRTYLPASRRDLLFFLAVFPAALVLGAVTASFAVHALAAAALVGAYGLYAWRSVRGGGEQEEAEEIGALYLDRGRPKEPRTWRVALQFLVALAAIVGGAELFVREVEAIASSLGVDTLVLALLLAPLATELPEKANSVLWVREGKDTLAVGNITGAMAFQSTVPVAFGLLFTPWELGRFAVAACALALVGAVFALWALHRRRFGLVPALAWVTCFGAFLAFVLAG